MMTKDQLDSYNEAQAMLPSAIESLNKAAEQFKSTGLANVVDEKRTREVHQSYVAAVRKHIAIVDEMAKALHAAGINM